MALNVRGRADRRRPVREHMTPLPHAIGVEQSVEDASRRLRTLGVRHLPVVEDGLLVGVVARRDVDLVYLVGKREPSILAVEDVMQSEPYVVGPSMPLGVVVRTMAEQKTDCCIVADEGRILGLLTTTDTLHLLADLLFMRVDFSGHGLLPSEVRTRILDDHAVLRALCIQVEDLAAEVLADEAELEGELRSRSRELYQTLLRHIELENAILVPVLRETDAYGPVRAEGLLGEHERQQAQLFEALAALERSTATELAATVRELVDELRRDMADEEENLLGEELLRDDPTRTDILTG